MNSDSTQVKSGVRFHRRSSGFILAILAILAGIAGVLLHFFGPAPSPTSNGPGPTLAQICAGLGAGCIWAAILLNFLWGLTSNGRYFATFFTSMIVVLPIGLALPPRFGLAAAVVVTLGGLALFFYEFGLSIEINSRGMRRVVRFPRQAAREIPWDRVERVFTDLRTITTYGVGGHFVESENRLAITGNGTKIALNTTRFEAVRDDLLGPLERGRPFAIAATLNGLNRDGAVRLGPIELKRDAILIRRFSLHRRREIPPLVHILAMLLTCGLWMIGHAVMAAIKMAKKPLRLPLEKIEDALLEKGSLVIVADRRIYLPLRRVPNGFYFPELLAALRSAGPAPVSR